MSADGVPPWARPVLEALQLAHSLRTSDAVNGRCATSGEIEMADAHVRDACAAALASDAGKTQGELCPECNGTGGFGPGGFCPNSGEWQGEVCEECGGTGKPLEPAAALDRLLTDFGALMWDHGRGRAIVPNGIPQRKAILAHVERVKREAAGEVVGHARIVLPESHTTATVDLVRRREKEEG